MKILSRELSMKERMKDTDTGIVGNFIEILKEKPGQNTFIHLLIHSSDIYTVSNIASVLNNNAFLGIKNIASTHKKI